MSGANDLQAGMPQRLAEWDGGPELHHEDPHVARAAHSVAAGF